MPPRDKYCRCLRVPGLASPGKEVGEAQRGWVRFLETQPGCMIGAFLENICLFPPFFLPLSTYYVTNNTAGARCYSAHEANHWFSQSTLQRGNSQAIPQTDAPKGMCTRWTEKRATMSGSRVRQEAKAEIEGWHSASLRTRMQGGTFQSRSDGTGA